MTNRDSTVASPSEPNSIEHPWFAALYDALTPMEWLLASHRRYLARELSGRVLDLGAGTGAMFPHVAVATSSASERADSLDLHAVEPDPHMRRRAVRTAEREGVDVEIRDARAEALPYEDASFDAVISAMVFCTVQDPDRALAEVARVLAPGGEFRFLEHVGADGWRGSGQRLVNPLWKRVAGGCHLTRDTVSRFAGHDAFAVEEIERVDVSVFPATPFVRGRLRRRREGAFG